MKRLIGFAVTALMIGALSATSFANDRTPYINRRQENQQDRIRQGIRSGELTRGEASRLESREGRLQAQKLEDKSKGYVTPYQRAHLNRELNRTSREIYNLKHNNRVR